MALQIVTAPTVEPVSLQEARGYARVDDDFTKDDGLISNLIIAARQDAEKITWRALVTQTWKLVADRFPRPGNGYTAAIWYGPQWGNMPGPITMAPLDGKTGYEIFLPKPPLQSVTSIKYIDTDGAQQTLDPSLYIVDTASEPGRLTPAYGQTWPTIREQANAVEIVFVCGYGLAAAVPAGIKRWMQIRVDTLYNNREEVAILSKGKVEILPYVDTLLDDFRVKTF